MKLYIKNLPKSIDSTKMLIEHLYAEEFPETFFDEELTETQCAGFKSRSFSDLFKIINTRFPSVTHQIFAYHLINKLKNSSSFGDSFDFKFNFCTDINKLVFKPKKCLFHTSLEYAVNKKTDIYLNKVGSDDYSFSKIYSLYQKEAAKREKKEIEKLTLFYNSDKYITKNIYLNPNIKFKNTNDLIKLFCVQNRPETFFDKECKIIQCVENKSRSISDLFLIVNTYFPSITFANFINKVNDICVSNEYTVYPTFCYSINKVTLYYDKVAKNLTNTQKSFKRVEMITTQLGIDGISLKSLNDLIKK